MGGVYNTGREGGRKDKTGIYRQRGEVEPGQIGNQREEGKGRV